MLSADFSLRLMTFNTRAGRHHGARLARLATLVDHDNLDVLVLQEVLSRVQLRRLRHDIESLPHSAYSCIGPFVKGGLVTFSRWPIQSHRYIAYGRRGSRPRASLGQWLMPKGAFIAQLAAGPVIINTHLQHNPRGDWSRGSRYAQRERFELRRLANMIAAIDPGAPLS